MRRAPRCDPHAKARANTRAERELERERASKSEHKRELRWPGDATTAVANTDTSQGRIQDLSKGGSDIGMLANARTKI